MKIIITILLLLSACAKPDATPAAQAKSIRSIWVAASPNWTVDMTQFSASGSFVVGIKFATGGACQADVVVTHIFDSDGRDSNSGQFTFTNGAGSVPFCAGFDGPWDYYTLTSGLLLCQNSLSCVELH